MSSVIHRHMRRLSRNAGTMDVSQQHSFASPTAFLGERKIEKKGRFKKENTS